MVELYWQSLTRDVPYNDYASDPLIAEAATELSGMISFTGPKSAGRVTPHDLPQLHRRRSGRPLRLAVSPAGTVPFGAMTVRQQIKTCVPDVEYMTDYAGWLACQDGATQGSNAFDPLARYIRNARDLGEYTHRDYSYQPYMNAALILLGLRAPFDANNPYNGSVTQNPNALSVLPQFSMPSRGS